MGGPRTRWFLASLAVLTGATVVATLQESPADPYRPGTGFADWFLQPPERNADLALPPLQGALRGAAAVPGTGFVWAVGDGGVALRFGPGDEPVFRAAVGPEPVFRAAVGPEPDPAEGAPGSAEPALTSVAFVDSRNGWITSRRGTVYRTRDGETWSAEGRIPGGLMPDRVLFSDTLNGWVGAPGWSARTSDGGRTWSPVVGTPSDLMLTSLDAQGLPWGGGLGSEGALWHWDGEWIDVSDRVRSAGAGFAKGAGPPEGSWFTEAFTDAWWKGASGLAVELLIEDFDMLGPNGMVYRTDDGGASWRADSLPGFGPILAHGGDAALVVGLLGDTRVPDDGGAWQPGRRVPGFLGAVFSQAPYAAEFFQVLLPSLAATDDGVHWIVRPDGSVRRSSDGGRSWSTRVRSEMRAVAFVSPDNGWAVGEGGTILLTSDGGESWSPQRSGTAYTLNDLHFLDGGRGWVVGEGGTILRTTDGGQSWEAGGVKGRLFSLLRIEVGEDGEGWTVGWDSSNEEIVAFETSDGGGRWTPAADPDRYLDQVSLRAPPRPAAITRLSDPVDDSVSVRIDDFVDRGGTERPILRIEGAETSRQVDLPIAGLTAVAALSADSIWVAGLDGRLFRTADGGGSWTELGTGTPFDILGLDVLPSEAGEPVIHAVGRGGLILSSHDGGSTWIARERDRSPAPWYWASCLLALALLAPVVRPRPPEVHDAIVQAGSSDRALRRGDPDPMEFWKLAGGLSRFLRNEATQPPLTIAVTGPWGSGKSSLMNLLRADLEEHGRYPVWFNAWHHQKEEHLLAALLEAVQTMAIPPWWRWGGLRFRLRLLARRGAQNVLKIAFLFLLVGVSVGAYMNGDRTLEGLPEDLGTHAEDLLSGTLTRHEEGGGDTAPLVGILLGLSGLALGAGRAFVAFRISPSTLLTSLSEASSPRRLQDQLGFRHTFASEFRDVTAALGERTLTIVIDDLDRCRPENVLDVLEAVNFLVSTAPCYVILGMEMDQVTRAVGLGFKDVVDEIHFEDPEGVAHRGGPEVPEAPEARQAPGAPGTAEMAETPPGFGRRGQEDGSVERRKARRRIDFARRYMEKLVNIVVPVPRPTEDQALDLLRGDGHASPGGRRQSRAATLLATVADTWPALAMVALFSAGWMLGFYGPVTEAAPGDGDGRSGPPALVGQEVAATGAEAGSSPEASTEPGLASSPVIVEDAQGSAPGRSLFIIPFVGALALGLWGWMAEAEERVRDSDRFKDALAAWHPLVVRRRSNPRQIKRFVNRVRYYAMVQDRPQERADPDGLIRRALSALRPEEESVTPVEVATRAPSSRPEPIPEDTLVALASLHDLDPEWLDEGGLLADPRGYLEEQGIRDEAVLDRLEKEGGLDSLGRHEAAFRKLAAGVEKI